MKTDYTVWYCRELNIWELTEVSTGRKRALTPDHVRNIPDGPLMGIFLKAQADPSTIQGITI